MTAPGEVRLVLTSAQARDFTACAEAAGLTLERWLLECAAVQAAQVIDALQAPVRRARNAARLVNEAQNAQHRERRALGRREQRQAGTEPTEGATRP